MQLRHAHDAPRPDISMSLDHDRPAVSHKAIIVNYNHAEKR
jgi:hypothetical protein